MKPQFAPHQMRIIYLCEKTFGMPGVSKQLIPAYDPDKFNVRVAITFEEGEQMWVARETIDWFASDSTVFFKCQRLMRLIVKSYSRVTGEYQAFMGGEFDAGCGGI